MVIYFPDSEGKWIPDDERWRHVRYEPPGVDWTHEREWRVADDLDLKKVSDLYALVWSYGEVGLLQEVATEIPILGILSMEHITTML